MAFGTRAQRLCERLRIDLPIIQAPMAGGWTTPALVVAVSKAGGLGMLAGARQTVEQLAAAIDEVRRHTDRPVGVNFLLAPPEPFDGDLSHAQAALAEGRRALGLPDGPAHASPPPSLVDAQIELLIDRRVPIVSTAMGSPARFVSRLRSAGVLVYGTATTVREAVELRDCGVDGVIAQGSEAGGHRGTFDVTGRELPLIGTFALVPQVVQAVGSSLPVVAAGAIMNGRGLAAALALGASAVQMGTRFLTVEESGAFAAYRERILESDGSDTLVTRLLSGRPARGLHNRLVHDLTERHVAPLPYPYQALAAADLYTASARANSADFAIMLAGQAGSLGRPGQHAADVVAEVAADARRVLRELSPGPSTPASSPTG